MTRKTEKYSQRANLLIRQHAVFNFVGSHYIFVPKLGYLSDIAKFGEDILDHSQFIGIWNLEDIQYDGIDLEL